MMMKDNVIEIDWHGEVIAKTALTRRMGRPEEVAGLALYLCSDEAGFVAGAAYPLDGGVTVM